MSSRIATIRAILVASAVGLCCACEADLDVYASASPPPGTCGLIVTPPSIDYGQVPFGTVATAQASIANHGSKACQVSSLALDASSDPEFSLDPAQASSFTLAGGATQLLTISFNANIRATPHHHSGNLTVVSDDPLRPNQSVALTADIDLGCDLLISPDPLNFGNLALNIVQTDAITISNDGTRVCEIVNLALASGTDADFTLAIDQVTSMTLAPGDTATVPVTFTATGAPPNLRTGALTFSSTQTSAQQVSIPLQGYIDTECTAASELIYTVDSFGMLASFDPVTLTYTDIAALNCPTNSTTFSMAVDQHAIAWVEYLSGEIFRVDTRDASCTATTFQPNQSGFLNFGMGFLFEPSTGTDTLYIAGGAQVSTSQTELGTISIPDLQVHKIGPVTLGWPELTGTGDGELWGFVPPDGSATGIATVAQIDPVTGNTLRAFTYPEIINTGGWAMKFFGGSFWIFLGNSVYAVSRDTAALTVALDGTSPDVVGAGVSTCAPLHQTGGRVAGARRWNGRRSRE